MDQPAPDAPPPAADKDKDKEKAPPRPMLPMPVMIAGMALVAALFFLYFGKPGVKRSGIEYGYFIEQLNANNIASVVIRAPTGFTLSGTFKTPPKRPNPKDEKADPIELEPNFYVNVPPWENKAELERLILAKVPADKFDAEPIPDSAGNFIWFSIITTGIIVFVMWMMWRRTRDQLFGGTSFLSSFSRSPAKRYDNEKKRITFNDVAGLESVKADLQEIVDFLKSPEKFHRLGGRIPKGVLLNGPPGTGKTLLARAVAGEAAVPFFSVSGSEFIQMFVGVGASRVRDLFRTAKEAAPAILFIDEIDAVGRIRGAGMGGGHDEREQTLNQILSEMDGFSPNESVIVIAATNRPDVLDPALLRPGRFDRHVTVDRPTRKGRHAILKVHTRDVPLADDVDLARVAAGTVGLTGADLANLVNEAALWATRQGRDNVSMDDFEYARDKVLMGPKREELISDREKSITAYHEAGHALLAWLLPGADQVHKVTIIPRGRALGVTQLLPEEDRMNIGERDLHARLTFILGGRAAEKLVFGELSAGAENDLQQATRIARRMVTHWGMSERVGPVAYRTSEEHPFLGKEYHEQREFSEHTAQVIDEEVSRILRDSAERAIKTLTEHRADLDALAKGLEANEELDEKDIEKLIGPSPNNATRNGKAKEQV